MRHLKQNSNSIRRRTGDGKASPFPLSRHEQTQNRTQPCRIQIGDVTEVNNKRRPTFLPSDGLETGDGTKFERTVSAGRKIPIVPVEKSPTP